MGSLCLSPPISELSQGNKTQTIIYFRPWEQPPRIFSPISISGKLCLVQLISHFLRVSQNQPDCWGNMRECTKWLADRIWQKSATFAAIPSFSEPWALRPYLCLWRWWDLVAGRLVGSKHNLQDFWPPGSPFRPNEGSADDLWDSRTYPSIQVCRKLDHGKFNNALRHTLLTPVGSNMGQEVW